VAKRIDAKLCSDLTRFRLEVLMGIGGEPVYGGASESDHAAPGASVGGGYGETDVDLSEFALTVGSYVGCRRSRISEVNGLLGALSDPARVGQQPETVERGNAAFDARSARSFSSPYVERTFPHVAHATGSSSCNRTG
jgi:hypothetical protein